MISTAAKSTVKPYKTEKITAVIPPGETGWLKFKNKNGIEYVISSDANRTEYYLYQVNYKRIAKADEPPELEAYSEKIKWGEIT